MGKDTIGLTSAWIDETRDQYKFLVVKFLERQPFGREREEMDIQM